jgi:hypothetical protein
MPHVVQIVQANAEFLTILPERVDLLTRDWVGDRQSPVGRWNIVVGRGHRAFRPPDWPTGEPQTFECLGARHLMHEVQIDVQDRLLSGFGVDDMRIPDLLKQRSRLRFHRRRRFLWTADIEILGRAVELA